ncbi:MAG: hypothetical protein H6712_34360 [Myxococcales bacterium]|nr:hypothetical protein [Myxococcales bacterium]MCB9718979.1 hypothetical protein [Myxococcales bacterium]
MPTRASRFVLGLGLTSFLSLAGCVDDTVGDGESGADDHDHDHDHNEETEIITTVTLTFTPQGGGSPVVAAFNDPDGDGGVSGESDPISLTTGTSYDLAIAFTNELVDPPEEITAEIEEEAEQHQIFVYGEGVSGPAAGDDPTALVVHAYADLESSYGPNEVGEDLPVGLLGTVMAANAGTGSLQVRLQHLPELNGSPQKVPGLAESLAAGELLPGEVDASVSFMLTVQ